MTHLSATQSQTPGLRAAFLIAVAALAASAGGCAGGDFGRTRSTFISDGMHDWEGREATGSIGRRSSDFQLTDLERQLRDLAFPFIEPPHSRPIWTNVFGDYLPKKPPWSQKVHFDRTAYGRLLIDEPHRSHASRYAQLVEDVRNDLTRLDPFFSTAIRVVDLDRKRKASIAMVSEISAREKADALARIGENALIVQWVQQCIQQRISSYRWALERLVIAAPDPAAADTERVINLLVQQASDPRYAFTPDGGLVLSRGG
jgi:hypothetical protein